MLNRFKNVSKDMDYRPGFQKGCIPLQFSIPIPNGDKRGWDEGDWESQFGMHHLGDGMHPISFNLFLSLVSNKFVDMNYLKKMTKIVKNVKIRRCEGNFMKRAEFEDKSQI
jgi:hypothetical protein